MFSMVTEKDRILLRHMTGQSRGVTMQSLKNTIFQCTLHSATSVYLEL